MDGRIEAVIIAETIKSVCSELEGMEVITPVDIEDAFVASSANRYINTYWFKRTKRWGISDDQRFDMFLQACLDVLKGSDCVRNTEVPVKDIHDELKRQGGTSFAEIILTLKRICTRSVWEHNIVGVGLSSVCGMYD